jgi:hypothetical protein
MSVDFYYNPSTHSIPSRAGLKVQWSNVPNPDVIEAIATEAQYLDFHIFVLKNSKHTRVGCLKSKPYEYQLGLSVRAGSIKAALLLCASIAEAVLRAHAEKRKYKLAKNLKARMFGNVLNSWKSHGKPRKDIAEIWDELNRLKNVRNNVHLFKAAYDPAANFQQVLLKEKTLMSDSRKVLDHLKGLVSP